MEIPQKIKNYCITQQFHFCEYSSKEYENTNLKRYMHPYVQCGIIYYSQDMETTTVSINKWIKKIWY